MKQPTYEQGPSKQQQRRRRNWIGSRGAHHDLELVEAEHAVAVEVEPADHGAAVVHVLVRAEPGEHAAQAVGGDAGGAPALRRVVVGGVHPEGLAQAAVAVLLGGTRVQPVAVRVRARHQRLRLLRRHRRGVGPQRRPHALPQLGRRDPPVRVRVERREQRPQLAAAAGRGRRRPRGDGNNHPRSVSVAAVRYCDG
uniref:Uncharacterized protein n=1 Tax=Zea mays TaxID=4577 RepID=A0A804N7E1_MAIZE